MDVHFGTHRVMKTDSAYKPLHVEEDQTGFDLGTNIWMAIVLFVMLVLLLIFLPIGWEFDMNSPDFNPMIFLPFLLLSAVLWNLGKGAFLWRRLRRFGTATMELHGGKFPVPGGICRGLIRTAGPIATEGDFQLTMTCVEAYRFRRAGEIGGPSDERYHSKVAWEKTLTVPHTEADPQVGLKFEFQLPEVAPLAQFIEPAIGSKPYFKMKASINIPGMKPKVIAQNQKPDRRSWWLEATAPTRDGVFRSKFQVLVDEGLSS